MSENNTMSENYTMSENHMSDLKMKIDEAEKKTRELAAVYRASQARKKELEPPNDNSSLANRLAIADLIELKDKTSDQNTRLQIDRDISDILDKFPKPEYSEELKAIMDECQILFSQLMDAQKELRVSKNQLK